MVGKRGRKSSKGRKRARRTKKISEPKNFIRSTKRKIRLVVKNLILFAVLALVSFLLYTFLENELFGNLFLILTMVLGFVGVAFLIILITFLIMRLMKK